MLELVLFFIPVIAIFSFLVGYFFRSSVSDWFFRKKTKTSYLDARSALTGLFDSNLLNNEIVSRLLTTVDNLIEQQGESVETKFEAVGNKIEQDLRSLQKERNLFNQQQQEFAKRKDLWREQILSQVQIKVVVPTTTPVSELDSVTAMDLASGRQESKQEQNLATTAQAHNLLSAELSDTSEPEFIAKKSLVSTYDFYQQMKHFSVCYSSEQGIFQQILTREQQLNPNKILLDPSRSQNLSALKAESNPASEFAFSAQAKEAVKATQAEPELVKAKPADLPVQTNPDLKPQYLFKHKDNKDSLAADSSQDSFATAELSETADFEPTLNQTQASGLNNEQSQSSKAKQSLADSEATASGVSEAELASAQEQEIRQQLHHEQELNAKIAELLEALIAGEISDTDFSDIMSTWQPTQLSVEKSTPNSLADSDESVTLNSTGVKSKDATESNQTGNANNQGIQQLLQNYFQHLPLTHGLVVDDVGQLLELQLLAGLLHLKLANYPQAIKVFKYIIEQERWEDSIGVVQAKINLARCYQQLGFSSRAVSLLTALLGQTEFDGEIIESLLEIHITNQNWQQALALGKKYYNLEKSAKNRELLINLYLDRLIDQVTNLQPRQVLYALQRIIELDPNYRRSHVLRANYLFAQGDYLTALEGYQDSLNLSIDLLPSLIGNLAYCYKQVSLIGEDLGTYLLELEQNYPEKAYITVYYDLYISGYPFLRQKSNFEFANKIISSLDKVSLGVNQRRLQQGRRAKLYSPKAPNRRLINNVALLVRNNRRDLRVESLAIRLNRLLELYQASKQDKVVVPFLYQRIFDLFSLLVLSVPNLEFKALLEAKDEERSSLLTNWKHTSTPAELRSISALIPMPSEQGATNAEQELIDLAKVDENHAWNLVQDYEQRLRNPYLYLQEESVEIEETDNEVVLPDSQVQSLVASLQEFLQSNEQKEIQQSYCCKNCSYQTNHLFWRCPSCASLDPAVLSSLNFVTKSK